MPMLTAKFLEDFQSVFFTGENWKYLANGFKITIQVTFFAFLIGLVFGIILAVIRVAHKDLKPSWRNPSGFLLNLLNKIANIYITVIRGTPTTIQLLIMFNVILISLDNLPLVAILTFGLNSAPTWQKF